MRHFYLFIVLCSMFISSAQSSLAQEKDSPIVQNLKAPNKVPIGKGYFANDLDALIFSTALIDQNGVQSWGTLRFTGFFNFGFSYNYNFNKNIGVYTGVDVKNIGYIEKWNTLNQTLKQRVYTVGAPLGFRLGNLEQRNYFFLGAGLDFAFHYKYKYWSDVQSKVKYNEWFSNRTELLMPYLFAGVAFKGTTLKIQYYPNNFVRSGANTGTFLPVVNVPNYNVNLLLLSIGKDIRFAKR